VAVDWSIVVVYLQSQNFLQWRNAKGIHPARSGASEKIVIVAGFILAR